MKKGKFSKFLLGGAMLFTLGLAPLTSCSTMFGEDGYVIKDITWVENKEQGTLTVKISTTDDEHPLLTFNIPRGLPGVNGVGIKDIASSVNEDSTQMTLVIKYTDTTLPDTIFTVPLVHGKDGLGIETVDVSNDKAGNVVIQFTYTDGTKSEAITIPRGIDGKDGMGIKDITYDDQSDENFILLKIVYTDETISPVDLKLPKGKNGLGIDSMEFNPDLTTETQYALNIIYSDGFVETIMLDKPQATVWHSGENAPDETLGKDGDFYLNILSGIVYKKTASYWTPLFSMKGTGSATNFLVTFNTGSYGTWSTGEATGSRSIVVNYGEYVELKSFPKIERTGYEFGGWWTSETDINAGQLTDLTPILKDMNLYPKWNTK